jgi:predicted transcriptional regulator of viral defense system
MNQLDIVRQMAEDNKGILLTKQVTEAGIPRSVLKELVKRNTLFPVQRGVYTTENGYADDFFLIQQKHSKGIYSHETALYLLDFSDRAPIIVSMTFKHGRSTSNIKNDGIKPVMVSHHYEVGVIERERPGGTKVKVYNIERTLADLLKTRYDTDYEQLLPALKRYAASVEKDINLLFRYARLLGVEEKMRNYMGALL